MLSSFANDFQVPHDPPYRNAQLVRVNDAVKGNPCPLPFRRLIQQVVISREERSSQLAGAVQQCGIIQLTGPILLSGKRVYPAKAKPKRDRMRHMVIHVEGNGH